MGILLVLTWTLIGYLSVRNWREGWIWKLASPLYGVLFAVFIIHRHDLWGQFAAIEAIIGCLGLSHLILLTGYAMKKDEDQHD